MVKSLVAQEAVSNCLLEYQLRVTPPKVAGIQSQLAIHEMAVRLLDLMDYKTITVEATTWKYFIGGPAGLPKFVLSTCCTFFKFFFFF